MNKKKLLAVAVAVLALLFAIPFVASAEETVKDGWYKDKGYYEYFENGYQYVDGEYWIDGSYFRFESNGKMINADWYRDPETLNYYYYQAGGYRADNCVIKIDGNYFGFSYDGVMYSNTEFGCYNYETEEHHYYYANSGGYLKTNEWVWFVNADYEKGGYWKRYGADGSALKSIAKVDNSYYFFYDDGIMLNDQSSEVYIEAIDDWKYIRAKAGGALYSGEWYKDSNGNWYYYTSGGYAAEGYTKVGSIYYCFHVDGQMVSDTTYYDGENQCSYLVDKSGRATKLNANGWTQSGKNWYYCVDGMYYQDEIALIGNSYYYFYWNGTMLDNDEIYIQIYNENIEDYDYGHIRAKKGGALYCGAWYQDKNSYNRFQYFDYNCFMFQNGFKTIGGNLYYFEENYAVENKIIETDSAVYVAGDNCVLNIRSTGWINLNDSFYYVENDQLVRNSMINVGGKYYILDDTGCMYSDGSGCFDDRYYLLNKDGSVITEPGWEVYDGEWYYINEDFTLVVGYLEIGGKTYYFYPSMDYSSIDYMYDEEGLFLYVVAPDGSYEKITANGYYSTPYGKMLIENGKLFEGWKNIGGKFYYFWPEMCVDGIYNLSDGYYYFDSQGVMISKAWIPVDNTYFYADAYGRLADGITWIGNKCYLFQDYRLAYNSYAYGEDGIYISDSNAIATLLPEGDGWKKANGGYYYVNYGGLTTGDLYIYENDKEVCYHFDNYSGKMISDAYYNGSYYDVYGRRFEGWKQIDGSWAYFGPYRYQSGVYYIGDNGYYFSNGKMLANTTILIPEWDSMLVIDKYGIITDQYDAPDGITYVNGIAYFIKDGEAYNGWYGSNYYAGGRMVIDEIINVDGNVYYIDEHGKYVHNGWHHVVTDGEYWIYANAYGQLVENDWLHLGNAWYYFEGCRMVSDGIYHIEAEDKYAEFDEYGRFIKYVDVNNINNIPQGKANTWKLENGKWHYYNSTGAMVFGTTLYIDNAWYSFDYNGDMIANDFSHYNWNGEIYYYTASGARLIAYNQWKQIDGDWCYFNANGSVETGWIYANNTRYYVADNRHIADEFDFEMYTGYRLIDGAVYYFNSYGACTGEYVGNGWLRLADGNYVYFKNGEFLKDGIYTIGNARYYFFTDGMMLANYWIYHYDESYVSSCIYASASGALYGTGWHNTANGWIYIDASGNLLNYGVYEINGGVYFFNNGYWVP